jgi:hypothetical protein
MVGFYYHVPVVGLWEGATTINTSFHSLVL